MLALFVLYVALCFNQSKQTLFHCCSTTAFILSGHQLNSFWAVLILVAQMYGYRPHLVKVTSVKCMTATMLKLPRL